MVSTGLRECATAAVLVGAVGATFLALFPTTGDPLPELEVVTFGLPLRASTKVMVLLSGWPDNHAIWKHLVAAFGGQYHLVSVATPDYDAVQGGVGDGSSGLRRAWGYTLEQVPAMIAAAVVAHLRPVQLGGGSDGRGAVRVDALVAHDLGALWAYALVAGAQLGAPELDPSPGGQLPPRLRVDKLVAIDVGSSASSDPAVATLGLPTGAAWCIPYQFMLATAFALGNIEAGLRRACSRVLPGPQATIEPQGASQGALQGASQGAARDAWRCPVTEWIYAQAWKTAPVIGPMGENFAWEAHAPRPQREVRWWMGYPYFYIWYGHVLRLALPPAPLFPAGVPTLFAFGTQKRAMFHTDAFCDRLKATPGCRVVSYDAGHWVMCESPTAFNADVRAFLES